MEKAALIVAAGQGMRMNSDVPKQFIILKNLPILMHTIKKFSHFEKIVLVLPLSQLDYWKFLCDKYSFTTKHILVSGGETRFHSVKKGLSEIDNDCIVAIHDGVRPLISKVLINKLVKNTNKQNAVIPIVSIKDSIIKIEDKNSKYVKRNNLYKVQTPQCFFSNDIKDAYSQFSSINFTDDASVFENNGGKIITVIGEERNLKITTEEDLKIAKKLL
tara:strand:- start:1234 stop:1884 length:651 start_codon:yes stop_codon:yes gene_type:complete